MDQVTNGYILDLVISSFQDIKLGGNKYTCKSYSISKCAYETNIIIDEKSKYYIRIIMESSYITEMLIIKRSFIRDKHYPVLSLKTKVEYDNFNKSSLEERIKKLSEMAREQLRFKGSSK